MSSLIGGHGPEDRIWACGRGQRGFIKPANGPVVLFNLEADPFEIVDVIRKPGELAWRPTESFEHQVQRRL